jgi:hypothetical protein
MLDVVAKGAAPRQFEAGRSGGTTGRTLISPEPGDLAANAGHNKCVQRRAVPWQVQPCLHLLRKDSARWAPTTRERRPTNGRRCRWRRGYHDKWKLRRNARDGRGPGRSEASQRATCHAQHGFQQYFRGRPGHITRRSPCFLLKLSIALRVRGRARPGARPSTSDTRGAEWAARCGDELVSK